ncbi:hypothetical protein TSUD_208070 [Trifolium subterraneum]|uniref:Uncharacterized protein n=1 Tax=Trifolium subterraneum TaxID=3900 RepID=A0A2Z6P0S4_TRISU|nr:hypothetical protein TSUD_208070 [Trifolium subterraneum]
MSKEQEEHWIQQEAAKQRAFEEINGAVGQIMGQIDNLSLQEEVQEANVPSSVSQLTLAIQNV